MRILVALDGSENSERSIRAIAAWVRSIGASVELFSVFDDRDIHSVAEPMGYSAPALHGSPGGQLLRIAEPYGRISEMRSQAMDRVHVEREDYLRGVVARYIPGADVTVRVEPAHEVAEAIVGEARSGGVDLIVVGTHGRTGLSHTLMGSVAEALMREAHVPVLVVGPNTAVPALAEGEGEPT